MFRIAGMTAIALSVSIIPSYAASLPKIDVEAECSELARFAGNTIYPTNIYPHCIAEEQKYYNQLKSIWPTISSSVQNYCATYTRGRMGMGIQRYSNVYKCLTTVEQQQEENRQFEQYKRSSPSFKY